VEVIPAKEGGGTTFMSSLVIKPKSGKSHPILQVSISMKIVMLPLLVFCSSLAAQNFQPEVKELVPPAIYLEAGGRQVTSIVRGTNLNLLTKVQVKKRGQLVWDIYTQMGPASDNRRTLSFLASPQCEVESHYEVIAVTAEGNVLIPLTLSVVAFGDAKATLSDSASLNEKTQNQSGSRIVISQPMAPLITATVPSPLLIEPNGQGKKILIQGENLISITEVRVRREDGPKRYKGDQGLLPFLQTPKGIAVEVMVGSTVPVGSKYILDLLVRKYLTASVLITVGYPAKESGSESLEENQKPQVIPLSPAAGTTP
jgi:hypothetical protein